MMLHRECLYLAINVVNKCMLRTSECLMDEVRREIVTTVDIGGMSSINLVLSAVSRAIYSRITKTVREPIWATGLKTSI